MESEGIASFYRGKCVFVTGATGFLGKILLEKLLRVCMVSRIFILVRKKKDKQEGERYKEIFQHPLFDRLRKLKPDFKGRVVMVTGDCALPNLGLSQENLAVLKGNVEIVFHCAATVRFDQKLRTAAYINVRATRDLVDLLKQMPNLKVFLHVSTAYSNCPKKEIKEIFYEPRLSYENLLQLVEMLDDQKLEECLSGLLGEWPNTYTYTKCISEDVVRKEAAGLPTVIMRPSIVVSTYKEPLAGWVDNLYGPVGVAYGVAMGLMRTLHAYPDNLADMVPADYVISAMMAAAWHRATRQVGGDVAIYNYVSTPEAPITWKGYMDITRKHGEVCPSNRAIWCTIFTLNRYKWKHDLTALLMHWIPAYFVDFILKGLGHKARLVEGYAKIDKFCNVLAYFTTHEWQFSNENIQALWAEIRDDDKKAFEFSMKEVAWDRYFSTFLLGGRIYLLKEPLDTIPAAKKRQTMLRILHYALVAILLGILYLLFRALIC